MPKRMQKFFVKGICIHSFLSPSDLHATWSLLTQALLVLIQYKQLVVLSFLDRKTHPTPAPIPIFTRNHCSFILNYPPPDALLICMVSSDNGQIHKFQVPFSSTYYYPFTIEGAATNSTLHGNELLGYIHSWMVVEWNFEENLFFRYWFWQNCELQF